MSFHPFAFARPGPFWANFHASPLFSTKTRNVGWIINKGKGQPASFYSLWVVHQ